MSRTNFTLVQEIILYIMDDVQSCVLLRSLIYYPSILSVSCLEWFDLVLSLTFTNQICFTEGSDMRDYQAAVIAPRLPVDRLGV